MPRSGYLAVAIAAVLATTATRYLVQHRQHSSQAGAPLGTQTTTVPSQPPPSAANLPVLKEGCQIHPYTGSIALDQLPYHFHDEEDLRGGMTCTFRVNSDLPALTFEFTGNPDNTFGNLVITDATTGKVVQTIENTTEPGLIEPSTADRVLSLLDANFDGYRDIQLMSNCGATGNCSYNFYLYDPKTGQFVLNDFLTGLGTPSFDSAKKQVITNWNSSAADWQSETYQYQGGQYTLIGRDISEWNRRSNMVTLSKWELHNGKMELVSSEEKHF